MSRTGIAITQGAQTSTVEGTIAVSPQPVSREKRRLAERIRPHSVRVWDVPLRLFHWVLVVSTLAALGTGFLAPEWWLDRHIWMGYAVGALLPLRIIWGLTGSHYSRFVSFLFSPGETLRHLSEVLRGQMGKRYLGHNPAGALMVLALLAILTALCLTGLIVLGGQEKQGPFAGLLSYAAGHDAATIHRFLGFVLLGLIAGHLVGVFITSRLESENLILSLFTGRKHVRAPDGTGMANLHEERNVAAQPGLALSLCAALGLSIAGGTLALARLPAKGVPQTPLDETYARECGDCHIAYHPSLLPAASWQALLAGLEDHFGEDASIDADIRARIGAYLGTNAAERWDTEAANNLRHVSPAAPLAITLSPYWTRRHAAIPKAVFHRRSIAGQGNCKACHRDADAGRFDDREISIPAK